MIRNKLKINDDKTELLVITSPYMKKTAGMELSIGQSSIKPSTSCKNLGAMFDNNQKMDIHISSVCRATHFHLCNIGTIRSHLTDSATVSLVHSLVTSRLDYCISLLYGLPDTQLRRLQRIQTIAARIVTRSPKQNHITPVLEQLLWLPVRMRVLYKLLVLTYRALEGKGPSYCRDIIELYKPKTSVVLRSDGRLIDLPWSNLVSYGDRAFSVAAPAEWKNLPTDLKDCTSYNLFKSKLKTYLFERYYYYRSWTAVISSIFHH